MCDRKLCSYCHGELLQLELRDSIGQVWHFAADPDVGRLQEPSWPELSTVLLGPLHKCVCVNFT